MLRHSRLPSGWTSLELLKHLTFRSLGRQPRCRCYVAAEETPEELVAALRSQAVRTRAVVEATDLAELGRPGPPWEGEDPASLERILFHLVQEYARHLGHLDIVAELADGPVGE